MPNPSEAYKQHLEREAAGSPHAQHIEQFYHMAKTMIEQMVPVLIQKYLSEHGINAALSFETYLNGARILGFDMELTNIAGKILRDALVAAGAQDTARLLR